VRAGGVLWRMGMEHCGRVSAIGVRARPWLGWESPVRTMAEHLAEVRRQTLLLLL